MKADNDTHLIPIVFLFLTGQLYHEATIIQVPTFIYSWILIFNYFSKKRQCLKHYMEKVEEFF